MLAAQARHWTWTVPEVLRMVEVGLLHEDDRAELIEGELVVNGVPEMWLVDLVHGAAEVYTEPLSDGWGSKMLHVDGQLAPHLAPQLELDVLDVLRARER